MPLRLLFGFNLMLILLSVTTLSIRPAAPPPVHLVQSHAPRRPPLTHKTNDTTPDTFYQLIIDTNLFRPLGWSEPVTQPQYRLIGTLTNNERHTAIILDKNTNHLYTLSRGQQIGNAIIEQIDKKRVILRQDNTHTTLYLSPAFLQ